MIDLQFKSVALIPARSGSKRLKDKNIKRLLGHPLIAYTIVSAMESRLFNEIVVSTDSEEYAKIAKHYGAKIRSTRPKDISGEHSPDIKWVSHIMQNYLDYDCYCILRPTSPFRKSVTIQRAFKMFSQLNNKNIDSLRAVELCSQHPGKMWTIKNDIIEPYTIGDINGIPFHSNQYSVLPKVYVQNASLEIAWTKTFLKMKSISGNKIAPFFTNYEEGFDINTEYDWQVAKTMIKENPTILTRIKKKPYSK